MLSPVHAALVALVCGVVAATTAGPLLRTVPEPELDGDDDKVPYASLATARTALACFCWATGLTLVACLTIPVARMAPWLVLAVVGSIASVIDIATTWIPRVLLHAGWGLMALAVLPSAWSLGDRAGVIRAGVGAAIVGGLFWVVWEVAARTARQVFGFADVRLGFLAGAAAGWAGWQTVGQALFLGCVVGAVWGVVTALARRSDGPFPYGPSIALGPFLAQLLGLMSGG